MVNMKVGFIGLGNMGSGLAANLFKAGLALTVYDIDSKRVQALKKLGAESVDTLQEMATGTTVVILCLPHPQISHEVIFGKTGLLSAKGSIQAIIDLSTLTPEYSKKIGEKLKKRSIDLLCAPMIGGKNTVFSKKIHFLIEGNRFIYTKYKSLFIKMGNRVDYIGPIPSATIAKLAFNILRYSNLATAVEVSRLVQSYTKNAKAIYKFLVESSRDNFGKVWEEDIKGMMLNRIPYKPSNIPEKDLSLIIGLVKGSKVSTLLFNAIREAYRSLSG